MSDGSIGEDVFAPLSVISSLLGLDRCWLYERARRDSFPSPVAHPGSLPVFSVMDVARLFGPGVVERALGVLAGDTDDDGMGSVGL